METVVSRLEAVAARLEALEVGSQSVPGTSGASGVQFQQEAPQSQTPPGSAERCTVGAWATQVMPSVGLLVQAGGQMGGKVAELSNLLLKAFKVEGEIIHAMATQEKPDTAGLQALLAPLPPILENVGALSRPNDAIHHHCKAAGEALQALYWPCFDPKSGATGLSSPAQHVQETWSSAEFWANRLLKEPREQRSLHVNWVELLKTCIMSVKAYVLEFHAAGPQWQTGVWKSQESADKQASSTAPTQSAMAAKNQSKRPKAPPPPPPGLLAKPKKDESPSHKPSGDMQAVLSSIATQGENVTAGLRKVTASMKAKNQPARSGRVEKSAELERNDRPKPAGTVKKREPRTECEQGKRWIIEHHSDNLGIIIDDVDTRQSVYIFKCSNCTIQIKGKVNAIVMDACEKTGLVFDDVIASCEMVNCNSAQMQVLGIVPSVVVDKCDNVQIYLSAGSIAATVTTAKSSSVNLLFPDTSDSTELKELYIPEQFVSRILDGCLKIEPVSHGGG